MIEQKKVLAVTLARGGSESIPKKNIAPLCGQPLIKYTIDEARKSKYIDGYIVSTDDDEIKEVCAEFGVQCLDRPEELARSNSKSSDALIHAVQSVGHPYYYVVELMATNPLKTVEDIDGCIEQMHFHSHNSVVAVVRVYDHHPSRVKYIEEGILVDFFPEKLESRRQDLTPPAYVRNGSIYAMRRSFLLEQKSRYNKLTTPYIMPSERSINIDDPVDLVVARVLLEERNQSEEERA